MLGLAASSEIREIAVCGFMLLNEGYQKEAHILPYIIVNCTPLGPITITNKILQLYCYIYCYQGLSYLD